jgi:hypothetical protein
MFDLHVISEINRSGSTITPSTKTEADNINAELKLLYLELVAYNR